MKKAVLDIGSNSIKFLVAEMDGGAASILLDTSSVTRLGEGLHETGALSSTAMERNCEAIATFSEKAWSMGTEEILAVGTMALRKASNSGVFLSMVEERTGIQICIIPGEEEARLSFLSVLSGFPPFTTPYAIFDTGGGSTEFIYAEGSAISRRFSVNAGAVRFTETFFPKGEGDWDSFLLAKASAKKEFLSSGVTLSPGPVVAMGGGVTTLSAVKLGLQVYDAEIVHGSLLGKEEIEEMVKHFLSLSLEARKTLPGLSPKRADVVLGGAAVIVGAMEALGRDQLLVSDRGLRHGLLYCPGDCQTWTKRTE